ncbi:MAG: hypothetical protein OXD46_10810 [Chloroflexi bacterium]|nr:hypothetical protein [Chloroflexota bacterium]
MERITNLGIGKCELTKLFILNSAPLVFSLALAACSQTDVERIREINESAAITPIWTAPSPTMTPEAKVTEGSLSAKIPAMEVVKGDCIDSTLPKGITFESVVIVACSSPWEYRSVGLIEVENMNRYPGRDYFEKRAYENCDRRSSYILYPPEESWTLGYRAVSCLQESYGLSVVDPDKLDRLVQVSRVILGECFNEAPETDGILVELVNCSGPWQYRVLELFEIGDQYNYPESSYFEKRAYENCDRRSSYILHPFQESWLLGDRAVSCLQESFGLSVVDPDKLDRLVGVNTIELGECFNDAPETDGILVELVSCSGPWEYRVLELVEVEDSEKYPREDYFERRAYEDCDRRYSYFLYPIQESWILGVRTISCLQQSFGLSVVDPTKLDRLVDVNTVNAGECFNEAPETGLRLVELVSCSGPWEQQVAKTFLVPWNDEYPGTDYFEQQATKECEGSDYYYAPDRRTWDLDNRVVACTKASNP